MPRNKNKCVVGCRLTKSRKTGRLSRRTTCTRSDKWSKQGETYDRGHCENPPPAKGKCRRSRTRRMARGAKFTRNGYGKLCTSVHRIMKPKGIHYSKVLRYIKVCGMWADVKAGRRTVVDILAQTRKYVRTRSKGEIEAGIHSGTCAGSGTRRRLAVKQTIREDPRIDAKVSALPMDKLTRMQMRKKVRMAVTPSPATKFVSTPIVPVKRSLDINLVPYKTVKETPYYCPDGYAQYCPVSSTHPFLGGKCIPRGEDCRTTAMASKLSNRTPYSKHCTMDGTGDMCLAGRKSKKKKTRR